MTSGRARLLLCALALCLTPGSVRAGVFLIQPAPTAGIDSAPYSFIPALSRGNYDAMYAFTGIDDESGAHHDFETFLRFELPPNLLGPGEVVIEAYAWVYYSFDYNGFGSGDDVPGELRCHEVLEPWIETLPSGFGGMTWETKPDYGPAIDVHPDITGLGLLWCDVTGLVEAWARGTKPNYGIAMTNPTSRLLGFYSSEAHFASPNLRPSLVIETGPPASADPDGDGVLNASDNCDGVANADQADADGDHVGDACDLCPAFYDPGQSDQDGDEIGDVCDSQGADLDGDGSVDEADLLAFVLAAGFASGEVGFRSSLDLDGDRVIRAADFALWRGLFDDFYTGPVAGAACGALPKAQLMPLATWWVEQDREPTQEFLGCYDLP